MACHFFSIKVMTWPLFGIHDDIIKWKHFPRYWPFVWGIHRLAVNSPHKGQWRRALMFFDLCLNKRLSKQSSGWWFEMPSCSLWCHCNVNPLPEPKLPLLTRPLVTNSRLIYVHSYVSANKAITGSDNDVAPFYCQAIIWTSHGLLLIGPLGKNVVEMLQ